MSSSTILVTVKPGATEALLTMPDGTHAPCQIGKHGFIAAAEKREGDKCTPLGRFPLRRIFYRPDRGDAPKTALPVVALSENDGWCDAPEDPNYNRLVKLPYGASHEELWRQDHLYDCILELGYNDDPPAPGKGSAIFLHLWRASCKPTLGCIAVLDAATFHKLVAQCGPGSMIEIAQADGD